MSLREEVEAARNGEALSVELDPLLLAAVLRYASGLPPTAGMEDAYEQVRRECENEDFAVGDDHYAAIGRIVHFVATTDIPPELVEQTLARYYHAIFQARERGHGLDAELTPWLLSENEVRTLADALDQNLEADRCPQLFAQLRDSA
mgnify:FL=1